MSEAERKAAMDKWVKNISDHDLSEGEKSFLAKGMNHAVTPEKLPMDELITSVEVAAKLVGVSSAAGHEIRSRSIQILSKAKPPSSNLTKEERAGMISLSKNKEIMCLPADKGRVAVVMNTSEYKTKIAAILSDENTYRKLKSNPTRKYKEKLVALLQDLRDSKVITGVKYLQLYPTAEETPKLYGLPKVHKANIPLRPIVACRGSIAYDTARFTADLISPLVGKTRYFLKNSKDLVEKLRDIVLEDDEELVSFDVVALFTSVPVKESIVIIGDILSNDDTLSERTDLSVKQVLGLLEYCLTTTYFQYACEYYEQVEGAAMGSPLSPLVANLFMEHFEQRAIESFKYNLKFWGRYVDDVISVLKRAHYDELMSHLNTQHKAIQWTGERETNSHLPALDVDTVRKSNGSLTFKVYRKPTHTDQYLSFDSNQPLQHKLGVIRTLYHRADTIVTDPEDRKAEKEHIKKALSVCGYPEWAFQITKNGEASKEPSPESSTSKSWAKVNIPYVPGVTESLQRLFRKHGVQAHAKPFNKVRSIVVSPKDKVDPTERCDTVYHIKCADCPATYTGESSQPLRERLKQHKRVSSVVGLHIRDTKHSIDWDNTKVLDRESNWTKRGVKEAINIRRHKPTLNKDKGRHHLPAAFDKLVLCDQHSRSSERVNPTTQEIQHPSH